MSEWSYGQTKPPQTRTAAPVTSKSGGASEQKVLSDTEDYTRLADLDKAACRAFGLNPLEGPLPPEFSEEDLVRRFVENYGAGLRYVAAWGKWLWLRPGGGRWVVDETLYVFDLVRHVCREAAAECWKPLIAAAIASAKTVAAVERLARSDRGIAATTDQWDADPWLLNTPAEPLDLRRGEICRRRPQAYFTKSTAVRTGGDCPLWRAFLKRITDGNAELERFLQRMAGYCLTGSTREHALFFLYGTGANGKSVLLNTLSGIMGDYARSAPIETFTASSMERQSGGIVTVKGTSGAERLLEPELMATLAQLRRALLFGIEHPTAADTMSADVAIIAYRNLLRVQGWIGSLCLTVERELFGQAPLDQLQGHTVGKQLTEQIARLEEVIMPLLERCHRMMTRSFAHLETRRGKAASTSVMVGQAGQVNVDCAVVNKAVR